VKSCHYIISTIFSRYEQCSRAIEGGATLALPALRLIICILDAQMAAPGAGAGNLNGFTWNTTITLVLTAWWT